MIEPWRVPEDGEELEGEESAEALELDQDPEARFLGPVHYALTVQLVSGELIVTGTVAARVAFACSRCGEPFAAPVRDAAFERAVEVVNRFQPVDLTPEIRESILLAFPTFPLCAAECRGLCATCGTNLNTAVCHCEPRSDRPGTAFDGLTLG